MLTFHFDADQAQWGRVDKDGQTIGLSQQDFLPYDLTISGLMGCYSSTIWDQWEAQGKDPLPFTICANWVKRQVVPTTLEHVDLFITMDHVDQEHIDGLKCAAYTCSMLEMVSKVASISIYLNDHLFVER